MTYDPHKMRIHDMRPISSDVSLDTQGFALVEQRSAVQDFWDDDEVRRVYYPEAERVIKQVTGASRVFIFDHLQRRRVTGLQDRAPGGPRQPATRVHVDHTAKSGPQRVRDLLPDEAEELLKGRVQVINFVAPALQPAAGRAARGVRLPHRRMPTTSCPRTWSTRNGSARPIRCGTTRRTSWYYVPEMRRDEALLLKIADTRTDIPARFMPHTSFTDPTTPARRASARKHRGPHARLPPGLRLGSSSPCPHTFPSPARAGEGQGGGDAALRRRSTAMLSGVYRFPQMESVVFGKPFAEALAQEVDRLDARAVFVLASGTLSRETDLVERLRQVLGNRFAGVCAKIGAHTPRTDVVAAANAAREAGADLIVTLGGGSVTDAAKMVGLCLGNDVTDARAARRLPRPRSPPTARPSARRSSRRACARSRSRRPCRPASSRPAPAAPTPRATSRKASAIR